MLNCCHHCCQIWRPWTCQKAEARDGGCALGGRLHNCRWARAAVNYLAFSRFKSPHADLHTYIVILLGYLRFKCGLICIWREGQASLPSPICLPIMRITRIWCIIEGGPSSNHVSAGNKPQQTDHYISKCCINLVSYNRLHGVSVSTWNCIRNLVDVISWDFAHVMALLRQPCWSCNFTIMLGLYIEQHLPRA